METFSQEKQKQVDTSVDIPAGFLPNTFMPGKPYQSKFLPFWDTIKALRSSRKSWREIADHLKEKCGVEEATRAGVFSFYKRKSKGRVPLGFDAAKVAPQTPEPVAPEQPVEDVPAPAPGGFFNTPTVAPKERRKPRYNVDI